MHPGLKMRQDRRGWRERMKSVGNSPKMKEVQVVYDAISLYIENALAEGKENNYLTRLMRIVETLEAMKDC